MSEINTLLKIMKQLRDPEQGCPWDLEQTFQSLIPYTLEEAYEVADAIEQNDPLEIRSELGDLLFQIVFYAQIASEQQTFTFDDVARAISEKLVSRHPHVFAGDTVEDSEHQTAQWEQHKQRERESKGQQDESLLSDIPRALPAMMRAEKLQRRVSRVGFDWPDIHGVVDKVAEELEEVRQELKQSSVDNQRLQEEIGDLLFSCVNLARFAKLDSEVCLRQANRKFEDRFSAIEKALKSRTTTLENISSEEWESAWQRVKSVKGK